MKKFFFPILFGGAIEGRPSYTEKCAHVTHEFTKSAGFETELIDSRDDHEFTHADRRGQSKHAKKLSKTFSRADGLIVVAPEYNHGYPGDIKNVLDSFFEEYHKKPMGIIGVSSGQLGGARMVEQMRFVAVALHMVPLNAAVYFSNVKQLFDDKGVFLEHQAYQKRFDKFFNELSWYAHALKAAKRNS